MNDIIVVGTISSGKSTLLNAVLGDELLPCGNLACTSMTVVVEDSLESKEYGKGRYVGSPKSSLYMDIDSTKTALRSLTESQATGSFYIKSELKNLTNGLFQVSLVDTPGVNDGWQQKTRNVAYNEIKKRKDHSILLYVTRVDTMGTDDDMKNLQMVSSIVGKNDRWYMVINAWDKEYTNPASYDEYRDKAYMMARKMGMPDPQIIYTSALAALLCRKRLSKQTLDIAESCWLDQLTSSFGLFGEIPDRSYSEKPIPDETLHKVLDRCGILQLEQLIKNDIVKKDGNKLMNAISAAVHSFKPEVNYTIKFSHSHFKKNARILNVYLDAIYLLRANFTDACKKIDTDLLQTFTYILSLNSGIFERQNLYGSFYHFVQSRETIRRRLSTWKKWRGDLSFLQSSATDEIISRVQREVNAGLSDAISNEVKAAEDFLQMIETQIFEVIQGGR